MLSRSICLSVSKKNEEMLDLIEEYADHLGMKKSGAIFYIIRDYHRLKLLERIREMETRR